MFKHFTLYTMGTFKFPLQQAIWAWFYLTDYLRESGLISLPYEIVL